MFSSHGHIPMQTSTALPTAGYVGLCLHKWWMDFLGGCHCSAKKIYNHSALFWDDKKRLSSLSSIITSPCSLGVRPTGNRLGSWGYIWYKCQCNKSLTYNSSVQLLSHVWLFASPWTAACQASLSITNTQNPPKPMSIELVMPSNHLIFCHALLLLLSIFPSIRVFSNESALRIRWPKYWRFSFSISPSNSKEHPGLISFRMDWLDLLAVQGTLKSLLQHHSSKASILWCSAFFTVQLSHPYYWKKHSLD